VSLLGGQLVSFALMAGPFLKELYVAGEDMGTNARDVALIHREVGISWVQMAKDRMVRRGLKPPI
jgi:hypothetical protein